MKLKKGFNLVVLYPLRIKKIPEGRSFSVLALEPLDPFIPHSTLVHGRSASNIELKRRGRRASTIELERRGHLTIERPRVLLLSHMIADTKA